MMVLPSAAWGQTESAQGEADSASVKSEKLSLYDRVVRYFSESNVERRDKKLDISFLGGPSYSSSTSASLAIMAAGQYYAGKDTVTPVSNMTIYAQGSVKGLYNFGLRGYHVTPRDRMRIHYHTSFLHFPSEFWGIGYDMEHDNDNQSDYTLQRVRVEGDMLVHLPNDVFIGPAVKFLYAEAVKMERPELWEGRRTKQITTGVGFIFSRDTRDVPTAPYSGLNLRLEQMFYPRFMGCKEPFILTDVTVGWYHKFYSSGVFAAQYHSAFTYGGHPGWTMMPTLDGSSALRGYFEGRYRDNNEMDLAVELRQHIWGRNWVVVWAGVGQVFPNFQNWRWGNMLPEAGLGYRWEFKKRVNVRVDFGLGRHGSHAFTLSLNEAF